MTDLHERQAVLFGKDRSQRGLILEFEGDTCMLVDSNLKRCSAMRSECVPMPMRLCFRCGRDDGLSDEERQVEIEKSNPIVARDFGATPPPERMMPLCEECAKWLYALDKEQKVVECNCAFRDGRAVECVCAARRARGFQPPT